MNYQEEINGMSQVVLSGGWGYGNLGDDAILSTTFRLLRTIMPGSSLAVMTYNPSLTEHVLMGQGIKILPSVHRYLVGDAAYKRFGYSGYSDRNGMHHLFGEVLRKINGKLQLKPYLLLSKAYRDASFVPQLSEVFSDLFGDAQLFIQSGGGYINSGWVDSVIAHSCELHIAKAKGMSTMVIGQSIGPFNLGPFPDRYSAQMAAKALSLSDFISVRDPDSARELVDQGISASVLPDITLADIGKIRGQSENHFLTIVVGALPLTSIPRFADRIDSVVRHSGLVPRITVSRLWKRDIANASYLRKKLLGLHLDCYLLIPRTWEELEEYLTSSYAVISLNLHGLILAWRSGVPVVAIGKDRKLRSFMEQIGQPEGIISLKECLSGTTLEKGLAYMIDQEVDDYTRKCLAQDIVAGFSRGLRVALAGKSLGFEEPQYVESANGCSRVSERKRNV